MFGLNTLTPLNCFPNTTQSTNEAKGVYQAQQTLSVNVYFLILNRLFPLKFSDRYCDMTSLNMSCKKETKSMYFV